MLCLHQQENKQIFTQLVVYQMKSTAREIKQQIIQPTIHAAWRVFLKLNWETIVTQIEKQIESQSSFKKDSGDPKNKKQNF